MIIAGCWVSLSTFLVDPCSTDPCYHNGKCMSHGDKVSCTCSDAYGGELCDRGIMLTLLYRVFFDIPSLFLNDFCWREFHTT